MPVAASKAGVDLRKNIVEQRSLDGHKKTNFMRYTMIYQFCQRDGKTDAAAYFYLN